MPETRQENTIPAPLYQPNLQNLYEAVKEADQAYFDNLPILPTVSNHTFSTRCVNTRPRDENYSQSLTNCVDAIAGMASQPHAEAELLREHTDDIGHRLDALLDVQPNGDWRAHATLCGTIQQSIQTLRLHAKALQAQEGLEPETINEIKSCTKVLNDKFRALIKDMITSHNLSGKNLVSFIEQANKGNNKSLYKCTIELDPAQQKTIFDESRHLRQWLGIRRGLRACLNQWMARLRNEPEQNIRISDRKTPEALTRTAIYVSKPERKARAMADVGRTLPLLKGFGNNYEKTQELCLKTISLLAQGLPHFADTWKTALQLFDDALKGVNIAKRHEPMFSLLSTRLRTTSTEQQQEIDAVLNRFGRALVDMMSVPQSHDVANAIADWALREIRDTAADPALKLKLFESLCWKLEHMPEDTPLRNTFVYRFFQARDCLPEIAYPRAFICQIMRSLDSDWVAEHCDPNILETIRQEELQQYPSLIAKGHAFGKHVLQLSEFDDIVGISKDEVRHLSRTTVHGWGAFAFSRGEAKEKEEEWIQALGQDRIDEIRNKYEEYIRAVMAQPDIKGANSQGLQYFYDQTNQIVVAPNPFDQEGGGVAHFIRDGWEYFKARNGITEITPDA